jgi:signal transduction histidine kinase
MTKNMHLTWLKKILNSVFTKLLAIILITGICINIAVWGFFLSYRAMAGRPFHRNISQYLEYVIDDLGMPPSYERARIVASRAALQIHFQGTNTSWSTASRPIDRDRIHFHSWRDSPNIRGAMSHGRFYIEYRHAAGDFIFELSGDYDKNPELKWVHGIIFLCTTLILIAAYFAIRWVLRPIKLLNEGVQEVGRGNLKHRVPVKKSDELGQLTQAFNTMTKRLHEMLTAKEQLLRDVSHELRSPLTRMKVALEFIKQEKTKKIISSDIEEMEAMISGILNSARMHHAHSRLNLQRSDITELINTVVKAAYQGTAPGIEFSGADTSIVCEVDPEQLKTVLKNILDNAVKYSRADSDPVQISIDQQPHGIVVDIKDDGIGIAPEDLAYIWEPFYRADKSRSRKTGGYGLGLSLCKTIMEAHGGKIEVSSALGKGTTVSLYIPVEK